MTPSRANADNAVGPFPTVIPLPDNWLPEGIAIGEAPYLPNAKFGQTVTEFEAVAIPVPVV